MSPQTVTGHRTGVTLGSAARTSRAMSQSACFRRERVEKKEKKKRSRLSVFADRRRTSHHHRRRRGNIIFFLPLQQRTLTSGSGSGLHRSSRSICASSCAHAVASGRAGGADIASFSRVFLDGLDSLAFQNVEKRVLLLIPAPLLARRSVCCPPVRLPPETFERGRLLRAAGRGFERRVGNVDGKSGRLSVALPFSLLRVCFASLSRWLQ